MKKILSCFLTLVLLTGRNSTPSGANSSGGITITNPINLETKTPDMSGYEWMNDSSPAFVEISCDEELRMFSEKGTGLVVMGYPGCAFCQRALPELNIVAKEMGITVYYVNVSEGLTEENYAQLCEELKGIFPDGSLQVPEVLAIKDGVIVENHLSLVSDYQLSEETPQMNDDQKKELQDIYREMIQSIAD